MAHGVKNSYNTTNNNNINRVLHKVDIKVNEKIKALQYFSDTLRLCKYADITLMSAETQRNVQKFWSFDIVLPSQNH